MQWNCPLLRHLDIDDVDGRVERTILSAFELSLKPTYELQNR